MSTFTDKLPQQVIQKWRVWASDPAFDAGINFLRHQKAPGIPRDKSAADKLDAATEWNGYHSALNDVETVLTTLEKPDSNLDEPSIRS